MSRARVNVQKVWLVRMPMYFANYWHSLEPADELGDMEFNLKKKIYSISLSNFSGELSFDMMAPDEHKMTEMAKNAYKEWAGVLSLSDTATIEGCILKSLECLPLLTPAYIDDLHQTFKEAHNTRRSLCLTKGLPPSPEHENYEYDFNTNYQPAFDTSYFGNHKPASDSVATISEYNWHATRQIIYDAFQKRKFYSIWRLYNLTTLKFREFKYILCDMCTFSNKHPNKFMWALKENQPIESFVKKVPMKVDEVQQHETEGEKEEHIDDGSGCSICGSASQSDVEMEAEDSDDS